jgi:hypothetical protein
LTEREELSTTELGACVFGGLRTTTRAAKSTQRTKSGKDDPVPAPKALLETKRNGQTVSDLKSTSV